MNANLKLQQGDVVRVDTVDPRGFNRKARPVLVVSSNAQISADDSPERIIYGIAISGSCREPLKAYEIDLPWEPNGNVRTGLKKRSTAVCNWVVPFKRQAVEEVRGDVSPELLVRIMAAMRDCGADAECSELSRKRPDEDPTRVG